MLSRLRQWRQQRIIRRSPISQPQWTAAFQSIPLLTPLTQKEKQRLQQLATLFLHFKSLEGAKGLEITTHMAMNIALQACLPILKLDLDWYDGWVSVIVYPAAFVPERTFRDEYGVEHQSKSVLSGESWHKGPVILSWEDSEHGGLIDGHNLVIHEFAHKLDVLNGVANGFPPLHPDMNARAWSSVMGQAFEDFQARLQYGNPAPIDTYAATSPAEFFAVFSEVFFERPRLLHDYYPAVYQQFKQFYRQDTLQRMGSESLY